MKKTGKTLLSAWMLLQLISVPVATVAAETVDQSSEETEMKEKTIQLNKEIKVENLNYNKKLQLGTKGKFQLTPLIIKEDALKDLKLDGKVVVQLLDEKNKVLSLDSQGNWEALKEGTTKIEFGYQISDEVKKAAAEKGIKLVDTLNTLTITVEKKADVPKDSEIESKGMTIQIDSILQKGATGSLHPSVDLGSTAKEKKYKFYYAYDPNMMSIDAATGKWTAKKSGIAVIRYGYQVVSDKDVSTDTSSSSSTTESSTSTSSTSSSSSSSQATEETSSSTSASSSTDSSTSTTSSTSESSARGLTDVTKTSSSQKEEKTTTSSEEKKQTQNTDSQLTKEQLAKMKEQVVAITESATETFWSNYGMSLQSPGSVAIGTETALKPTVDFGNEVAFNGTYRYVSENPEVVSIADSGMLKAIKAGTTKITYDYQMDKATLKKLVDKGFDLTKLASDSNKEISVTVSTGTTQTMPWIHTGMSILLPETITVGEEYKFKINLDKDLTFDGKYQFDFNQEDFDLVLNKDQTGGSLVAKKTGKLSFKYGYVPSETMYAALVKANDGKALTDDPGIYNVNVQPVQKPAPMQKPDPLRKLPQTGEQKRQWAMIAGVIIIIVVIIVVVMQRKKKKNEEK